MRFKRVVSLSPSITEVLFALGFEDLVAGVTDACDYPREANSKPHVCSWFSPDMDRLLALRPDLVIGLKSAHGRFAPILGSYDFHLELLHPTTIEDALQDMVKIGDLLAVPSAAHFLVDGLERRLAKLAESVTELPLEQRLTVMRILDIADDELIVAGPQSFQYDVIARAGGINLTSALNPAYPKISFQQLHKWDPAVIFVCGSDEDYPARLISHPKLKPLAAVQHSKFYQFDCGLTCRTGPRIVDMAELLFRTLYVGK
ncbi:MAG: helical backbone metal receptor [Deltaproteobacteria bacterium]